MIMVTKKMQQKPCDFFFNIVRIFKRCSFKTPEKTIKIDPSSVENHTEEI